MSQNRNTQKKEYMKWLSEWLDLSRMFVELGKAQKNPQFCELMTLAMKDEEFCDLFYKQITQRLQSVIWNKDNNTNTALFYQQKLKDILSSATPTLIDFIFHMKLFIAFCPKIDDALLSFSHTEKSEVINYLKENIVGELKPNSSTLNSRAYFIFVECMLTVCVYHEFKTAKSKHDRLRDFVYPDEKFIRLALNQLREIQKYFYSILLNTILITEIPAKNAETILARVMVLTDRIAARAPSQTPSSVPETKGQPVADITPSVVESKRSTRSSHEKLPGDKLLLARWQRNSIDLILDLTSHRAAKVSEIISKFQRPQTQAVLAVCSTIAKEVSEAKDFDRYQEALKGLISGKFINSHNVSIVMEIMSSILKNLKFAFDFIENQNNQENMEVDEWLMQILLTNNQLDIFISTLLVEAYAFLKSPLNPSQLIDFLLMNVKMNWDKNADHTFFANAMIQDKLRQKIKLLWKGADQATANQIISLLAPNQPNNAMSLAESKLQPVIVPVSVPVEAKLQPVAVAQQEYKSQPATPIVDASANSQPSLTLQTAQAQQSPITFLQRTMHYAQQFRQEPRRRRRAPKKPKHISPQQLVDPTIYPAYSQFQYTQADQPMVQYFMLSASPQLVAQQLQQHPAQYAGYNYSPAQAHTPVQPQSHQNGGFDSQSVIHYQIKWEQSPESLITDLSTDLDQYPDDKSASVRKVMGEHIKDFVVPKINSELWLNKNSQFNLAKLPDYRAKMRSALSKNPAATLKCFNDTTILLNCFPQVVADIKTCELKPFELFEFLTHRFDNQLQETVAGLLAMNAYSIACRNPKKETEEACIQKSLNCLTAQLLLEPEQCKSSDLKKAISARLHLFIQLMKQKGKKVDVFTTLKSTAKTFSLLNPHAAEYKLQPTSPKNLEQNKDEASSEFVGPFGTSYDFDRDFEDDDYAELEETSYGRINGMG